MSFFDWLRGRRKPEQVDPLPGTGRANTDIESSAPFNEELENDESGPKRPLLYMFQYVVLPEAAFQNHPELIREFEDERSGTPLLHFWSKSRLRCHQAGLMDPHHEQTDSEFQQEMDVFDTVTVHSHKRNGYTAHVVAMPVPEFPPEAHFVAIVHKDGESKEYGCGSPSTRYFTLEKSDTPLPFLCECRQDGSRQNYGEGSAPDIKAFVEAVFYEISRQQ